jgi:hypothetical protein
MALTKISTNMLKATGTPDSTTYLRGDGVWATPDGTVTTAPASSLTKIDLPMITTTGTQSSSSFFRGDGMWSGFTDPIWVTQSGNIAIVNEQVAFSANILAVDPNGLTLTYTVTSGALPSGLTLNSSTGVISGTTPQVTVNTVFAFIINVSNSAQNTQQSFTITVNNSTNEPPVWSTAAGSLGSINMNSSFNYSLSATDPNSDPITYSVISGSLPTGLSMSSLGVITGTATTVSSTTTSNFTVQATDSNFGIADRSFSITIMATSYTVTNSLRLYYPSQTAWLERTPPSNGSNINYAVSFWVKKANNGTNQAMLSVDGDPTDYDDTILFNSANQINITFYRSGTAPINIHTTSTYTDLNKWYHICLIVNTNESIQTDRAKLYIDGVRNTSWAYQVFPSTQGMDVGNINQTRIHYWGRQQYWGSYFGGYLAECYIIDNQTVTVNDFGIDIGGIWKPKKYVGPLGPNGSYLEFKNANNLGQDSADLGVWNSKNWSLNNITSANSSTDTPNP